MGRTYMPTFRVELDGNPNETFAWSVRDYGRPTEVNLSRYVQSRNDSYLPGGVNVHLNARPHWRARIIRQRNREVVATWKASVSFTA